MQSNRDIRGFESKTGFDPDYLPAFEQKMFIAGPQTARRLTNFFVLLLLATVIATFGVISESTATVIGAMIVAPLMGPIMATAAAVVIGSGRRALNALALVAVGVASVIVLSWLLTFLIPDAAISFQANGEITSRIEPGLMALLTALASGAAGAYIMAHEEIADSMGGVAIAISLVPPLCVVGISLNEGQFGAAAGALMLFATNFLAILLAGGITFMLLGLGQQAIDKQHVNLRRNAFILILMATFLVAVPLTITSYQAVSNSLANEAARRDVDAWLVGTEHQATVVDVQDQLVRVTVEGSGTLHPLRELANRLAQTLRRPVLVNLRVVPAQAQYSGDESSESSGAGS
ncbi:MAG: DUF389 domain-containing protein [Caldilineaceae bacterium]